jgi:hypothetical protein
VHVALRQALALAGQFAALRHCTQLGLWGSQYGVPPLHTRGASYWPVALQVSTWLPLHTVLPG